MNLNLNVNWKNICIDYNDDENEDDDEPDFMDNSGKCWEYGRKIEDEKHLKEWCQNKMGGMIVGKEEKLTRQFHCQIKQCQFKAIFLKSCSTIYTRNKHIHALGNMNQEEKANPKSLKYQQDYVDKYGKLWPFRTNFGINVSHDNLLTKFGFNGIAKSHKTLHLYCYKSNPAGGKCPFRGIFFKSNGCLYTRGEHEHTKRGKTPQNIGDDYVDIFGKIWKFNKEIGPNVQQEMLRTKFGFNCILTNGKGLNLICQTHRLGIKCKFVGVYLKSNGCLYTRGKHNHEQIQQKKIPENIGDDYVDHWGKIWKFKKEIGKNVQPEMLRNEFGSCVIRTKESTLNLLCETQKDYKKCKFAGIYLKSNGCLYTRGKHNHEQIQQKNLKPIVGDDYVDIFGKAWHFHSKIGKNIPNGMWFSKFGFTRIRQKKQTLNLNCRKITPNGKQCPFAGIYVEANGCLYIRGKHEHKNN